MIILSGFGFLQQKELEKSNQKLVKTKAKLEQEKKELEEQKDKELEQLREQLKCTEDEVRVKGQDVKSHKATIEKVQEEQEQVKVSILCVFVCVKFVTVPSRRNVNFKYNQRRQCFMT